MHYSYVRNLLVWLIVVPWLAEAQGPSPAVRGAERELAFSGEPGAPPLLLHGAPDVTVTITFDVSVKREEVRSPPGVEVRPHPFRQDGVLVTPASTVAAHAAVPFTVPLTDGTILNFAFVPAQGTGDVLVRVRRVPRLSEREALVRREGELRAALAQAVDAAAGLGGGCTLVPVNKTDRADRLSACRRAGEHAYVRIEARCSDAKVGISGSPQGGASIVFEETECAGGQFPACNTRLVLRKATEGTAAVTVELRGRDGALCESHVLQAW